MADIQVTLQGDKTLALPAHITVQEALSKFLSNKQRKQTVAAIVDGQSVDLATILVNDAVVSPILMDTDAGHEILRHSTAHVMAQAVRDIFGADVKVAIGPAIEDGFYYDFSCGKAFSPEDLDKIEARMQEIIGKALPFVRGELKAADALAFFEKQGEKYKVELIRDLDTMWSLPISLMRSQTSVVAPTFRIPPGSSPLNCCGLPAHTGAAMRKMMSCSVFTGPLFLMKRP